LADAKNAIEAIPQRKSMIAIWDEVVAPEVHFVGLHSNPGNLLFDLIYCT
jgi:hypothetical protein